MTERDDAAIPDDAHTLRAALRSDLVAAMKARQPEIVTALRTTIAAIDNAEAVAAPDRPATTSSEHVAGAEHGVGSTEAQRQALTVADLHAILRAQIIERTTEAAVYESHDQHAAAARLRQEAQALGKYLPGLPAGS